MRKLRGASASVMVRAALRYGTLFALASCGGGGDESPCSSATTLLVGLSYPALVFKAGQTSAYPPILTGVPQSCTGGLSFSVKPQPRLTGISIPWPSTLSLDGKTGVISGTLAYQPGECTTSGGGWAANTTHPACIGQLFLEAQHYDVTLSIPGYSDVKIAISPVFQP